MGSLDNEDITERNMILGITIHGKYKNCNL